MFNIHVLDMCTIIIVTVMSVTIVYEPVAMITG